MVKKIEEDMNDTLHAFAKTGNFPQLIYDREEIINIVNGYKYNLSAFVSLSKFVIDYLFRFPPRMFDPEMTAMIKLGYYMNQNREFKDSGATVNVRRHFDAIDDKSEFLYIVDMIEFATMAGYITILYANVDETMGSSDISEMRVIFGIANCAIDNITSNVFDSNNKEIDLIMNKYFSLRGITPYMKTVKDETTCLTISEKLLSK